MGEGARRYPAIMNATTTPNLVAAKRRAIQDIYSHLYDLITVSAEAVIFVLTLYEAGRGMMNAGFRQIGRSSAPQSVRRVLGASKT